MRGQEGVTLTGFIMVAVVVIIFLLFGFKVGPAYFEYWTIQKQLKAIVADPASQTGSKREIEAMFASRATMERITSIGHGDLLITKEGGGVVLSAEYSVRVPLFGNLSACMDFSPNSSKP
jgi:uncharacterized protein DUF4845